MRIALVVFKSLNIYAIQLANALCKLAEIHLFIADAALNRYLPFVDASVVLHPTKMFRWRNPEGLWISANVVRDIKRSGCDLAHLVLNEPWFNLCIPFLRAFPLITTVHDVVYHTGDRRSNILPRGINDLATRFSSAVIVHGVGLKEQLCREFKRDPEEVYVIPLMNFSFYRHWETPGVTEETNTILFFGSIWEYKGLKYLMEAEPVLTEQLGSFKIVIAGTGEDFAAYRKYIIDPQHYEVINEYIPDERVADLFQKATLVVLPYIEASQSGVVPLAFAFGKPVVATRVGSIPEIVDHGRNGLLVNPRDSKKLAMAIVQLLKAPELRKRMSQEAREKAEGELSLKNIAQLHMKAYTQTLEKFQTHRTPRRG